MQEGSIFCFFTAGKLEREQNINPWLSDQKFSSNIILDEVEDVESNCLIFIRGFAIMQPESRRLLCFPTHAKPFGNA